MTRYIDADEFKKKMECYLPDERELALKVLKSIPTADVVERKDLDKITEAHEEIGYEKGYRDGYAQAVEDARETVAKIARLGK